MSYLLHDLDGAPWVVFTGDALFAGDVGRVDLLGMDRAEEMAGLLHSSIFDRLLPLGDGVLVCPAHGAGSVCGSSIAEKPWTSIGAEHRLNPRLQAASKDEFVADVARELEQPPYFRQMEKLNLEGAPLLGTLPVPRPLSVREFAAAIEGTVVLDTRNELAYGAAHIPGSLYIRRDGLPDFAGWFLTYDKPVLLVTDAENPKQVTWYLVRLGFDNLAGYLSGGMLSWHKAGQVSNLIRTSNVHELCGWRDLVIVLGGIAGWKSVTCPVV
jgi:hydroxyacylglutathione hydrolase